MNFPEYRARRVRNKQSTRSLLRETQLSPQNLICPLWVAEGKGLKDEITSLPGVYRYSVDRLKEPIDELAQAGVCAVLLFGMPRQRDALARGAVGKNSVVARAISQIKEIGACMTVITDIGLASYTMDGRAGVIERGAVDNESTLDVLAEMALLHGRSGADFVSPSAGVDGQVGWLRESLDEEQLEGVGIVPAAVHYGSVYACSDAGGDEVSDPIDPLDDCRIDPANSREAIREASLDVEEGADMLMVRPALPYLDVIARMSDEFELPLIAFSGAGEYRVIQAAAQRGWIDGERATMENLLAIKRAGADGIVTYSALQAARRLPG